jgi:hypothetical protein
LIYGLKGDTGSLGVVDVAAQRQRLESAMNLSGSFHQPQLVGNVRPRQAIIPAVPVHLHSHFISNHELSQQRRCEEMTTQDTDFLIENALGYVPTITLSYNT